MDNTKVFFISDTHFGHDKIIEYCNRPFDNVSEMNQIMIENWNSVVGKNDLVFHLGDFAFRNKVDIKNICKQLNGRKILKRGNHDRESNEFYRNCGFENVYEYAIVYQNFYILSHANMYLTADAPWANIHGHIHNNHKVTCMLDNKNLYYNVSVEVIDYTPISFQKIKEYYST